MTITFDLPKHKIGSKFIYKYGKQKFDAEIIGYHIEHNTDTDTTNVTYRIAYNFAGLQDMTATVARSTVDKAMLNKI